MSLKLSYRGSFMIIILSIILVLEKCSCQFQQQNNPFGNFGSFSPFFGQGQGQPSSQQNGFNPFNNFFGNQNGYGHNNNPFQSNPFIQNLYNPTTNQQPVQQPTQNQNQNPANPQQQVVPNVGLQSQQPTPQQQQRPNNEGYPTQTNNNGFNGNNNWPFGSSNPWNNFFNPSNNGNPFGQNNQQGYSQPNQNSVQQPNQLDQSNKYNPTGYPQNQGQQNPHPQNSYQQPEPQTTQKPYIQPPAHPVSSYGKPPKSPVLSTPVPVPVTNGYGPSSHGKDKGTQTNEHEGKEEEIVPEKIYFDVRESLTSPPPPPSDGGAQSGKDEEIEDLLILEQ